MNYPPRLPEQPIIDSMTDSLKEIIPLKIEEIMQRQDEVNEAYQTKIKVLDKVHIDEPTEYFWVLLAEIERQEYFQLQKWLKYWLRLAEANKDERIWQVHKVGGTGFTDADVEKARAFPIEELYGGKLRAVGSRYTGKCPFHEERTPSFYIFTQDNHFHCFGCGKHGDAIDFYMLQNDCSFQIAIGDLIK